MKSSPFLQVLLTCEKNQAKALLETADPHQVGSIVKIIHNISQNSSLLSAQTQKLLTQYKTLILRLSNKNNSEKKNYSLIRNNSTQIYNLLHSSKKTLLRVLK
jgi:hypothetical protein